MTQATACRWQIFDDATSLQQHALNQILTSANAAISARGKFLLVLAGGTTPRAVYQMLREAQADWANWHIYFGDERCQPPEHADRNSKMAQDAWLDHVAIPKTQIHPMPAEQGALAATAAYNATLQNVGTFDVVLLGLGEDGHTASLFPGKAWDTPAKDAAIAVFDAPKPPPERVSLSASRLADARAVVYLVTGAGKRDAVQQWRDGESIPAAAVKPVAGVDVLVEVCCI